MKKIALGVITLILIVSAVITYNKFTLFVIQPIGAVPEGKTIIIERSSEMPFIDSADAMCKRRVGSVSLFCRARMLGEVAKLKIYARLPYSEWLYLRSTEGVTYDR